MFEAAEKRVNRSGSISYWKDDVLIGKRCTKCGEDKEITEFSKKRGVYKAICKKCKNSDLSKWRKEQPKRTKKYINEDGIEVRVNKINTTYWKDNVLVGKKCTECGAVKSISEFYIHSSTRKECKKILQKEQRAAEKRYINEDGLEVEVNKRYGTITYWKEGTIVGRRCNKCGEDKEISQFRFDKNKKCYSGICKSCYNEYNRQYKKENIESIRINLRKYRKENPEKTKEIELRNSRKRKNTFIKKITDTLHQLEPIFKELNIKAYGYIYKITGPNNRCYIGQTTHSLNERYKRGIVKGWIKERRNRTNQKYLEDLENENNFIVDIIDYGICQYHLDKLEAHYINKYDSYNNGYNNNSGHYKSDDGLEEFQQILSTHNLEYKDGKIIKKPTSTDEID